MIAAFLESQDVVVSAVVCPKRVLGFECLKLLLLLLQDASGLWR